LLAFTLGIANLTLRRRLPPSKVAGGLLNLHAFIDVPEFSVYCLASICTLLGLYTPLIYIDSSAVEAGISSEFSFYLVAISNASGVFGRYTAGLLCDRFGAINTLAPMTAIAAIVAYAWPFAEDQGSFIAIAIIYGFASGAYVALIAAPIIGMGQAQDAGRRIGMSMGLMAMGALAGPPIAGVLLGATGGFRAPGYYAGSIVMLASTLMMFTKKVATGGLIGKY